jgi:DNA-binding NtrC family response regulator/CHASE2 domain-containing sensor protein
MQEVEVKPKRLWKKTALVAACLLLPLLLFQTVDFLEAFEWRCLDFMMALRGARNSNSNLIMVTVDDETGKQLGSPLPRRYYSQVLRALSRYGAKTIVVDLMIMNMDANDAKADSELAAATEQLRHVLHAFYLSADYELVSSEESGKEAFPDTAYAKFAFRLRNENRLNFIAADSAILPPPFFLRRFAKAGVISIFPGLDGLYRRLPTFLKYRGRIFPGLWLAALCEYWQIPPDSIGVESGFWGYGLRLKNAEREIEIPIDRDGQILLNFDGSFATFKSYSILQIVRALQDIEEKRAPQISLHDFAGKIVVIGNNETIAKDYFPTPLSEDFPGMGIQATALGNVFDGTALREWPWHVKAAVALMLGAVLSAGLTFMGKIDKARETIYAWIFFVLLALSYNLLAYFLFFKNLNTAPAILPINSALALLFIATMFYEKSLSVEQLNRRVRTLEDDIAAKAAHIQNLNLRIGAQDEQYKAIDFFIGEIESVLNSPAAEQPRSLETPLMKMQLFKEHLKNELERRRAEKQILDAEKEALASQITVYKILLTGIPETERTPPPEPAPEKFEEKFQEVNRVLESYKAFVQKAKAAFYYDASFAMVTAMMNGRSNGQAAKTKLQEIFAQIARIAQFDSTVLITGETGTGKELAAAAILRHSYRKNGPFVVLNCAAIPETLMESELFGHVKGAFTGALSDRAGAFEQANHGTIFLDEIGDLKPDLQAKLLRVLQEKKVQRLGSNKLIEVDVRVIAATNRNLQELMQREQFRNDLYFRLDVANIHLPPLRERKEEIPHLVHYFLARFSEKNACAKQMTDEALTALIVYDWPGNVRELQHLVEKVCVNTIGEAIRLADLPEKIQQGYREIFAEQKIQMWEAVATAATSEMENLREKCEAMLRAGGVEAALQAGEIKLWGSACENCYAYMKSYIDSKAAAFPQEQREKLAKQIIVGMSEQLIQWCKEHKLGPMQQNWEEIEKLLGRTRRMLDNWKRELGTPG